MMTPRRIKEIRAKAGPFSYPIPEEWKPLIKEREDILHELLGETERLVNENSVLRTLVAKNHHICPYGMLQEGQSMAHCPHGFPGCSCADDLICGEEETFHRLLLENRELKKRLGDE